MAAVILDGKTPKQQILDRIKNEVATRHKKPGLAVVLVGDDPASRIYVANKEKACREVGFYSEKTILPATVSPNELFAAIDRLNADPQIHGILCQFPLPVSLNHLQDRLIRRIDPAKDVDGLNPASVFVPCTPKGIMTLLKYYDLDVVGRQALVIGRSDLVGKPVSRLLLDADATVTIAHSRTGNLPDLVKLADIVVAALGQPEYIKGDWIKPGAIVIDVGINRTETGLLGDVEFSRAKEVAGYITPVPGGIGPMTIASLMENVLAAALIPLSSHQ